MSASCPSMRGVFESLVDCAVRELRGGEVLLANLAGEESDFVRFNDGRVRQPSSVRQAHLTLTLIDGQHRDATTLTVSFDPGTDGEAVRAALGRMRADLAHLPADPYLLYATTPQSSERIARGHLPAPSEALDAILDAGQGNDLVGIYASGPIMRGFANSFGQRNWHEVDSFNFEWSLYHAADKAVKSTLAGSHFRPAEVAERVDQARAQLTHLCKPAKTIAPGLYRAYIAPAALNELLAMLNWGAVSAKAQRTKQSALQKLVDGEMSLSPKVTLREHTAAGMAPAFDEVGFVKPPVVDLIEAGRYAGSLVSPRTGREYGIAPNGAGDDESMGALDLAPGSLPAAAALETLGDGIYIGNLWYLNFSDRANGRVTGLTRFATFWVEEGRIRAPLNVMRFDDTLYRMLGENLLDLTAERDWIMSASTYTRRSVETSRVPGALLREVTFTL